MKIFLKLNLNGIMFPTDSPKKDEAGKPIKDANGNFIPDAEHRQGYVLLALDHIPAITITDTYINVGGNKTIWEKFNKNRFPQLKWQIEKAIEDLSDAQEIGISELNSEYDED
jgi:hypothetical protein